MSAPDMDLPEAILRIRLAQLRNSTSDIAAAIAVATTLLARHLDRAEKEGDRGW